MTALLAVLVSLNLSACERIGGPDADGAGASATLVVEPDSAAIGVGDDFDFDARVVDRSGAELSGYTYSWSVSDPSAASVDTEGTVTGRATANVEVSVEASPSTAEGTTVSNAAPVEVLPGQVAGLSVSPASPTIELGDTIQLVATVTGEDGEELDRTIQWASSDTSVARTDAGGLLIGEGDGTTSVLAQVSDASDTADVSVDGTPAASVEVTPDSVAIGEGETARLEATVYDSSGDELDRTVSWSSSNTSVVTVDPLGQIQGQVEGEALITAQSGEASGTAKVAVQASNTGADPYVVEDFSTYSSTSDLLSDPRGIYTGGKGDEYINLDTTEGLDKGGYSLSKSMRYTFDGSSQSIVRSLDTPDDTHEIWIEMWVKFSSNFKTEWGDPDKNADYKFIFAVTDPSRFSLKTGTFGHQYTVTSPADPEVDALGNESADEWDGQWHRYRLHFKHESTDGACDGTAEVRIANEDGGADHYVGSVGDVCTDRSAGGIIFVSMGRNMNEGTSVSDTLRIWWGRTAIWTENPRW